MEVGWNQLTQSKDKFLVRSIFEHCPVSSSSDKMLYFTHCKQFSIIPVHHRFDFHDLKRFHLLVHKFSSIKLPTYLHFNNVRVGWDSLTLTIFLWSLLSSQLELVAPNKKGVLLIHTFTEHICAGICCHSHCVKLFDPVSSNVSYSSNLDGGCQSPPIIQWCVSICCIWEEFVTSTTDTGLENDH